MKATVSITNVPNTLLKKSELKEGQLYLSTISNNKNSIYFVISGILLFANSELSQGIGNAWRNDSPEFYEAPKGTSFTITQ